MKKFIIAVFAGLYVITGSLLAVPQPSLTPEHKLLVLNCDVNRYKRRLEELQRVSLSARTMKLLRIKGRSLQVRGQNLSDELIDETNRGLAFCLVEDVRKLYSNFSRQKYGFVYNGQQALPSN